MSATTRVSAIAYGQTHSIRDTEKAVSIMEMEIPSEDLHQSKERKHGARFTKLEVEQ